MSTVSVIIPVYNAERFLKECLDSVAAQTHGDFEVITVDDGSTDGSAAICRSFAQSDKRFKHISRENGGVSEARNTGIDAASGHWLIFVDADDRLHPQALERLLHVADTCRADIAIGKEVFAEIYTFAPMHASMPKVVSGEKAAELFMYQREITNSMHTVMFSSRLGPWLRFRPGTRYEDLLLGATVMPHAQKVAIDDNVVYHYRDNDGNFMNEWSMTHLDVMKVTDELCRLFAEHPTLGKAARDRRFSAAFNMFIRSTRAGRSDIGRQCWQTVKQLRASELSNTRIRPKNYIGALVSLTGYTFTRSLLPLLQSLHLA